MMDEKRIQGAKGSRMQALKNFEESNAFNPLEDKLILEGSVDHAVQVTPYVFNLSLFSFFCVGLWSSQLWPEECTRR